MTDCVRMTAILPKNYEITSEYEIPVYYYSLDSTSIGKVIIQNFSHYVKGDGYTIGFINTGDFTKNHILNGKEALLLFNPESKFVESVVIKSSEMGYDDSSIKSDKTIHRRYIHTRLD